MRATDYTYDGLNRLRTEVQYPAWPTTPLTLVMTDTYDGDGKVIQTDQTDAFGVPTSVQGASAQPFGFTGQQRCLNPDRFRSERPHTYKCGRFSIILLPVWHDGVVTSSNRVG